MSGKNVFERLESMLDKHSSRFIWACWRHFCNGLKNAGVISTQSAELFYLSTAPPQFLLFADASNRRIMKGFPQDSLSFTFLPLSSSLSRPVAVAYDFVEDRVYWTDVWRSTISRSFLNGSSQEVIIHKKLDYPYGLAVDFIGRNLYWADTYNLGISKLDGSHQKALITTNLYQPRDIILDVNRGYIFWKSDLTAVFTLYYFVTW